MSTKDFDPNSIPEEVRNMNIDELAEFMKPYFDARAQAKNFRLDKTRLEQIHFVYLTMRYLTQGSDVEVTYDLDEPEMLVASVKVEGHVLEFTDPEWFTRAAALTDNIEVVPFTNGGVRLLFGFNDFATLVYTKEGE